MGGGSRPGGLLPPVASGAKSVDGFRKMVPEGLRSRIHQELQPETGGRKSEDTSPASCRTPSAGAKMTLTPLRASQGRSGRRSTLHVHSPQGAELVAVHKSLQLFFTRLPSERGLPFSAVSKASAGAPPMRTRSLSLERTFGSAAASPAASPASTASPSRTPSLESTFGWSSPENFALRREVGASPERPAEAKSLKPLPERRKSVTRGRELPAGLRKWSRAEWVVRAPTIAAVHFPDLRCIKLPCEGCRIAVALCNEAGSARRWFARLLY